MPVFTIGIVRERFYLFILYCEEFLTWVWRLPFAVNANYLSITEISFIDIIVSFFNGRSFYNFDKC